MRLLIDQDVYQVTVDELRRRGHDAVTVKELQIEHPSDERLLVEARRADRILITRDKGFGAVTFLKEAFSTGVILLRLAPTTAESVHRELDLLFRQHTEDELKHLFCVVEPHRHRVRRLREGR